jgi:nitrate reductase NapD
MAEPSARFHVAGVVVHALPPRAAAVGKRIGRMPGAVVHGASAAGKLAVTLEAEDGADIVRRLSEIQLLEGVLSAALVSEHSEPLAAADEVIAP